MVHAVEGPHEPAGGDRGVLGLRTREQPRHDREGERVDGEAHEDEAVAVEAAAMGEQQDDRCGHDPADERADDGGRLCGQPEQRLHVVGAHGRGDRERAGPCGDAEHVGARDGVPGDRLGERTRSAERGTHEERAQQAVRALCHDELVQGAAGPDERVEDPVDGQPERPGEQAEGAEPDDDEQQGERGDDGAPSDPQPDRSERQARHSATTRRRRATASRIGAPITAITIPAWSSPGGATMRPAVSARRSTAAPASAAAGTRAA